MAFGVLVEYYDTNSFDLFFFFFFLSSHQCVNVQPPRSQELFHDSWVRKILSPMSLFVLRSLSYLRCLEIPPAQIADFPQFYVILARVYGGPVRSLVFGLCPPLSPSLSLPKFPFVRCDLRPSCTPEDTAHALSTHHTHSLFFLGWCFVLL